MARNLVIVVLAALLALVTVMYVWEPRAPWKPVLETTGFEYLDDQASRIGAEVAGLEHELGPTPAPAVHDSVDRLQRLAEHLREYYLPLTRVRQLVYDADRLLYLGDAAAARRNLTASIELLRGVGGAGGERLRTLSEELILIAERALLHLDEGPRAAEEPLQTLGHRVNLLLLKGELELDD